MNNSSLFPFQITIDDGYGAFQYDVQMPGEVSIYDLIKALGEKFPEAQIPSEGTFLGTTIPEK